MALVSNLSLEGYLQLRDALTAGGGTGEAAGVGGSGCEAVRRVSPIEEPFFKLSDLRQLLALHGLSAPKLARTELLQALVGCRLADPMAPAPGGAGSAAPSVGAGDMLALGWVQGPPEQLAAALAEARSLTLPSVPAGDAARAAGGVGGAGDGAPSTLRGAPGLEAGGSVGAPAAAPTAPGLTVADTARPQPQPHPQPPAPPRAPPPVPAVPEPVPAPTQGAPQHMDAAALVALLQQQGLLPPGAALVLPGQAPAASAATAAAAQQPDSAAAAGQLTGAAAGCAASDLVVDESATPPPPEFPHSTWLRAQLRIFRSLPGCAASAELLLEAPPASGSSAGAALGSGHGVAAGGAPLVGRRVAFVLDSAMEVCAGKGAVLRLPPGVFQVRAAGVRGGHGETGPARHSNTATQRRSVVQHTRVRRRCAAGHSRPLGRGLACTSSLAPALNGNDKPRVAQGRAIRCLGSACRPDLCGDAPCGHQHLFCVAKIIPPPHDVLHDMAAASAAAGGCAAGGAAQQGVGAAQQAGAGAGTGLQAAAAGYAAALGRLIELVLDLHPRLRAHALDDLLALDATALQVRALGAAPAWCSAAGVLTRNWPRAERSRRGRRRCRPCCLPPASGARLSAPPAMPHLPFPLP